MTASNSSRKDLHDAINAQIANDEMAVSWVVVIDVIGPNNTRYLSHRAGGGADGLEAPPPWTVLGMGQAISGIANDQMLTVTYNELDLEDGDDEHG